VSTGVPLSWRYMAAANWAYNCTRGGWPMPTVTEMQRHTKSHCRAIIHTTRGVDAVRVALWEISLRQQLLGLH
jgi:hypothetical protein